MDNGVLITLREHHCGVELFAGALLMGDVGRVLLGSSAVNQEDDTSFQPKLLVLTRNYPRGSGACLSGKPTAFFD